MMFHEMKNELEVDVALLMIVAKLFDNCKTHTHSHTHKRTKPVDVLYFPTPNSGSLLLSSSVLVVVTAVENSFVVVVIVRILIFVDISTGCDGTNSTNDFNGNDADDDDTVSKRGSVGIRFEIFVVVVMVEMAPMVHRFTILAVELLQYK